MSNINIGGRAGQANGAGSVLANMPEIWQKEILASFDQNAIAPKLFLKRVLDHGKVAKFRVMGKGSANFHVAGEDIFDSGNSYVSDLKHNIQEVFIDRPLVAAETLDLQDMAMIDIPEVLRMEVTEELGRSLARTYDKYALQKAVMAARESTVLTGGDSGEAITDADGKTNAASLIDTIFSAIQKLDEKNIPMDERVIVLRPAQYYVLVNDSTNNASRFNLDKDIGSEGSFALGHVGRIGGVPVIKTNHLPITDLSSAITGDTNDYSNDFSTTFGLVCHKSCIAQAMLKDLKFHSVEKPETLSINIMAYLMTGFGVIRPESAIELKTA